jgi:hypothetical protein
MRQFWLCAAIVIILINGCSSAGLDTTIQQGTDQPSVSIVRSPTDTLSAPTPTLRLTIHPTSTVPQLQPSMTPSPSFTPSSTAISTQECLYASKFIEDITIQDGSVLPASHKVEKIWRVRNTGTCPWVSGTSVIHIKGSRFDSQVEVPIPSTQPGEVADIRIVFTAPSVPGKYDSYWRLENSEGELFGGVLYMRFNTSKTTHATIPALPSATPSPTQTPVAISTSQVTPTKAPTYTVVEQPTETPVQGCGEYNPQFMGVLSQASLLGLDVGCAMGPVFQSTGLVQEYWYNVGSQDAQQRLRSLLIRNNDSGNIYVLVGKDTLTYEANVAVHNAVIGTGGEAGCGAPTPPDGFFIPQNAFTKVWCENEYWKTAGWPRLKQASADLTMQKTEKGILIRVHTLPTTVYYLALDLEINRGTVQMGP